MIVRRSVRMAVPLALRCGNTAWGTANIRELLKLDCSVPVFCRMAISRGSEDSIMKKYYWLTALLIGILLGFGVWHFFLYDPMLPGGTMKRSTLYKMAEAMNVDKGDLYEGYILNQEIDASQSLTETQWKRCKVLLHKEGFTDGHSILSFRGLAKNNKFDHEIISEAIQLLHNPRTMDKLNAQSARCSAFKLLKKKKYSGLKEEVVWMRNQKVIDKGTPLEKFVSEYEQGALK